MATLLFRAVAKDPDARAVIAGAVTLTWAGLDRRVDRWSRLLRGSGLVNGDRVALVVGNGAETVEAVLACLHTGLVVVPVNWHFTTEEIAFVLADSDSRLVVVDTERAETVAAARARLPGPAAPVGFVLGSDAAGGFPAVEPALAAQEPGPPPDERSGALMLYTSGTTGRPRGVRTSLFPLGEPVTAVSPLLAHLGALLGLPRRGRVLLVGPWYHSAQLFFAFFPLLRGCDLVVRPAFDAADTLATIDRERVTACHLVPTQFVRLLRLPREVRERFGGTTLTRVWHGGGPCAPAVKRQMIAWWGLVLTEYYGATEAGVATMIDSTEWLDRPGSVGRSLPATALRIVGADGAEVGTGGTGTVYVVRAPGRSFAYHGDAPGTRAAHLEPGVFTCGDIGRLDDDGYLHLTGRRADLIVTGGVTVSAVEVESVLLDHPAVRDVAVHGVPDVEYGQRLTAVVEPEPGIAPEGLAGVLDRHCRVHLAGFKIPRGYTIVATLPRDPSGKLRRAATAPP